MARRMQGLQGMAMALGLAAMTLAPQVRAEAGSQLPLVEDFTKAPIELAEAGIYCPAEHVGTEPAPDTESGYVLLMEGDQAVALSSRKVPAHLDISFGVRIRLAPGTMPGDYTMVVLHPPFGDNNVTRESWDPNLGTDWGVRSFQFEFPYEMALGRWAFEVHRGDEVLMRQSFVVVPPMEATEAIDLCFGDSFVS